MGIREDLIASEAEISEYLGIVRATTMLAAHEHVANIDAARWLLNKRFHQKLPAFEIGAVDLLIDPLGDNSSQHAEEILWSLAAFESEDDTDSYGEEVFWRADDFLNGLIDAGIELDIGGDSDAEHDLQIEATPPHEHACEIDQAESEVAKRFEEDLQAAHAEIERLKALVPPRPDARLMTVVIATQRQFWADWADGSPRPKSEETIIPWIRQQFIGLSDADARAVDRVACPVDRNPASRSSGI